MRRARTLEEQRDEVERVLVEIGAEGLPQILVYNKLDALQRAAASVARLDHPQRRHAGAARVRQRADGHGVWIACAS